MLSTYHRAKLITIKKRERETTRDEDLLQQYIVYVFMLLLSTNDIPITDRQPPRYMVIASVCDVDAFVAHESEKDNTLYVGIDNVY